MNFLLAFPQTGFWMLLIKSNCREIRCTYTFLQLPLSIELNPKSFSTLFLWWYHWGTEKLSLSYFFWILFFFRFFSILFLLTYHFYQSQSGFLQQDAAVRQPSTNSQLNYLNFQHLKLEKLVNFSVKNFRFLWFFRIREKKENLIR